MDLKNKRDFLLMTFFRKNARENLTYISRKTKIPISTIFDKLQSFERGLIKKHASLIDFKRIGFDIHVNIMFRLPKETRESFRDFLMMNEHVNSLFRVNNGYDYLVDAIFKDMSDFQKFTDLLDSYRIEARQELFVLEDLKRESFLSEELHVNLLR